MSPANDVNNPRPNIPRGYNQFPQSYMHLTTERYGEYDPFYWVKCERGDIQNLHSQHQLHSFTMKSPFVGKLKKTKSYVKVPMYAIYPRTWTKQFTIPTQGDDVPSNTRALLHVRKLVNMLLDIVFASDATFSSDWFRALFTLEAICSDGSLFSKFNMHLNYVFGPESNSSVKFSFDELFDEFIVPQILTAIRTHHLWDSDDQIYYITGSSDIPSNAKVISPRRAIELLRRGDLYATDALSETSVSLDISDVIVVSGYDSTATDDATGVSDRYLNIEPIIAYQLACAQFATNDFVDFIYSAELYRDNMQSLAYSVSDTSVLSDTLPVFLYNGVKYQYDVFSQKTFDTLMSSPGRLFASLPFWLNLFSYVPSLRYGDYFTGGKPTPLAVGEYTSAVNNNEVSAIDITRSIQMQRLLHRVNMVGRKIGDYLSGIFGGKLPEAPKDVPIFLAHQIFDVDGFEVNNTGDQQLSSNVQNITTTNLRSTKDKFAFEVTIDEPCYIIGMSSYSMMRVYSKTMDRFAFHHDRFDDFIPEMQYIGDQDIKAVELDSNVDNMLPYAYALRYMEYKQRYSYASGGFIRNLPSWSFITDNSDGNPPADYITPDYIRSSPSEFDRFYKSLTGYSLGTYFHFIVAYTNNTAPLRRMEYTPEILK